MNRDTDKRSPMQLTMPVLVVAVAAVGLLWVRLGVRDLQGSLERREAELTRFECLAEEARLRPDGDLPRVAAQMRNCLDEQRWHRSIKLARPTVVVTEAGLTLELAPRERPAR